MSLSAVALFVAVQGESFVLSSRDYRILGVLPVARGSVSMAKLASLMVIVGLLHLALNTLPGLILPMVSPLGYLRPALALQLTLLVQTVFVCAAIVAGQGLLGRLAPRAHVRRLSSLLQFAIVLVAVGLFVGEGVLSRLAYSVRDSAHLVNLLVPAVWFHALHLRLAGIESASLTAQAAQALGATAIALAVAVPCCLAGYRDDGGPVADLGQPWLRLPRLTRWLPRRRPVVEAVAFFTRRTVSVSPAVALIARGWFALGLALVLSGLGGLLLRHYGRDAPTIPSAPLYAPAIVLPFFALVGLRLAAAFPSSLEANWIFRLTETPRSLDYAEGTRAAAMRVAVWPVLAGLSVPYLGLWGPWRAIAHLVFAWALAGVTCEWLFLGFSKVPFTCSYRPDRARLRLTWPRHAAVFFVYCAALPALASWLLERPHYYAAALVLLLVAREASKRVGRRLLARDGRLVFDDKAPASLTTLELEA